MVNTFADDLKFSHSASDSPLWEVIYREAFANFQEMVDLRRNGLHQKQGIDRLIVLSNGKTLTVDEKVRRRAYPDVLLEYGSVVKQRKIVAVGWVCDPDKQCDYIAYAWNPLGAGVLLPYQALRNAWKIFRKDWVANYGTRVAQNKGWTTWSTPVPTDVLLQSLALSMNFSFQRGGLITNG